MLRTIMENIEYGNADKVNFLLNYNKDTIENINQLMNSGMMPECDVRINGISLKILAFSKSTNTLLLITNTP